MESVTIFDYFKIKKKYEYIEEFILKEKEKDLYIAGLEYWENPHFVLDRINNRDIRREIINILINASYDFKSSFPYKLDKLQKFKLLNSVKNNLQLEYDYYNKIFSNSEVVITKDNLKCLICNTPKNILSYAFRFNYDIFINIHKNNQLIALNNKYKCYSLNNIYNILNKLEANIWVQRNNNFLKVKQHANSNINLEQVKEIIFQNTLKQ